MRPFHHLGATFAGRLFSRPPKAKRPLLHLMLLLILLALTTTAASQERFLTKQRIDQLELRLAESESVSASVVEHLEKLYSQLRASRSEGEQLRQELLRLQQQLADDRAPQLPPPNPRASATIDGQWRLASSGGTTILEITSSGDVASVHSVRSGTIDYLTGELSRHEGIWSGHLQACFKRDPTSQLRSAEIRLELQDSSTLSVRTEQIVWDASGAEQSRSPVRLVLRRSPVLE